VRAGPFDHCGPRLPLGGRHARRNCRPDPALAVPTLGALGGGGSHEPITETLRRICPFCNGEAVKEGGQRSVMNGTLKSLYRCQVCDVPFLWVRPIVENPRGS
jgi:hypothetical protein